MEISFTEIEFLVVQRALWELVLLCLLIIICGKIGKLLGIILAENWFVI